MKIPLSGFEEYIDETILKRGLAYFRKGMVLSFDEAGPGEYDALVRGTEDYTVHLTVRNGMLEDHRCDCPYDKGQFCKHEVAALYYLQQEELGLSVKHPASKGKARPAAGKVKKPKPLAERVEDLLDKASPDELRAFLQEQAAGSASFRNLLLSSFAQHDAGESKATYARQVKAILRSARDRQGFVNWSAASHVGCAVIKLLTLARQHLQMEHWESAFFIATAVMEEMVAALQFADDSNGDIGSCIREACDLMYDLARQHGNEQRRSIILEYCLATFDKGIYSGWDWEVDMLRIALLLIEGKKEVEQLDERIGRLQGSDYTNKVAQELRYELIAKTEGAAAADRYVEAHLSSPSMRRIAISKAFEKGQYDKAMTTALDGVESEKKGKTGFRNEWYDWLLKIAQATDDGMRIIEHARYLFLNNSRPQQDYYEVLKRQVGPETWNDYLEKLLQDIAVTNRFLAFEMLAGIFVRESMLDRLVKLLSQSPSLARLADYEPLLAKAHAAELIELYATGVTDYLQQHTGRPHYQTACRFLRRMNKLGGRERVVALVSMLRAAYPSRKALLEELDKV
jgi:hypothetical protein